MGNKPGKLSFRNRSRRGDYERLLKSSDEENFKQENLMQLPDEKDIPTENLAISSDVVEDKPMNNLAEMSNTMDSIPPKNLEESSNAVENVPVGILVNISDAAESIPLENLWKQLNDENKSLIEFVLKSWNNLKYVSLESDTFSDFATLWFAEHSSKLEISGTSDVAQRTSAGIFRLRVFVSNCSVVNNIEEKSDVRLTFYEYIGRDHENDSAKRLLHVTRYNSQRKKDMDCTAVTAVTPGRKTKYLVYFWDSKQKAWRIIKSWRTEMVHNTCFSVPSVWAQRLYHNRGQKIEKIKCLSQSRLSTKVPLHIERSYQSEIHMTAYNFNLDEKFDVSLVEGRTHDDGTEFYFRGGKSENDGYSFTVRNHDGPVRF